ncbi:prenyltransferase-like protein [Aspergillus pseudoustus]|uniref:Aromatic prenyltransferase n=1 Tax=Aspergillus pseudoustus TaxID=1810923 RepID=A0ABR4IG64_9EURO
MTIAPPMPTPFSKARFLTDLKTICTALNTPFSETTTSQILTTFKESFSRGAVLLRTTDQPNGDLNYRVYERQSVDLVSLSINAGLLPPDSRLGKLVQLWSNLYGGQSHQLADFDAEKGLVKFWVFLGGIRPLHEILAIPGLPECIARRQTMFESLGLTRVRHTAVDLDKGSINLYFRTPPDLSRVEIDVYISLAGSDPIDDDVFYEVRAQFPTTGGTFAVTMDLTSGEISRMALYALRLDEADLPVFSERIKRFFDVSASYDPEEMKALAWSFGPGGKMYVKAEHSYTGDLVGLLRNWRTNMSSSDSSD